MQDQFFLPKPALQETQEEILIEVMWKESPSGPIENLKSKASSTRFRSHDLVSVKSRLPVPIPRSGALLQDSLGQDRCCDLVC